MPTYTLYTIISVILVILLDFALGTKLFLKAKFWTFQAICFCLQLVFDMYLTARPIYVVNNEHILGLKIGTIPLENLVFGFSMLSMCVILFEFINNRKTTQNNS